MGKDNNAIIRYLSDKRRFADLFNAVLYGGRQVLDPEKLTEVSGTTYIDLGYREGDKPPKPKERRDDITMRYDDGGLYRILIGEMQSEIDYLLPLRNIKYLASHYDNQYEELKKKHKRDNDLVGATERLSGIKKTDRLVPVHMIWLYHGEKPWDGPRSFKDILDLSGADEEELKCLLEPRLLCVNEMTDFGSFHTELRELLKLLSIRGDKNALRTMISDDESYSHLGEDTIQAASVLLRAPKIWKNRKKYQIDEEGYDMCTALKEWREEIIEETTERVDRETTERVERETTERVERETTERVERETTERVERDTSEKETIQHIRSLILVEGFSIERALHALGIPGELHDTYIQKLKES